MTPPAATPANDSPAIDFEYVVLLTKLGAAGAEAFEDEESPARAA